MVTTKQSRKVGFNMYTISKEFHFSASHQLFGLSEGHQCGRLHGHNYILTVYLQADSLQSTGFVQDYGELSLIKEWIDKTLDHRHLNDVFEFNTTVENMCRYIYELFKPHYPLISSIEMSETPKTRCKYEPESK